MEVLEQTTEHRSFIAPDEVRRFPHGRAEILHIGHADIGRLVLEPGWRWSNDVKPIVHTDSCQAPHFQYHVSGRLAIRMDDGTEFIAGPGDIRPCPRATMPGWWATSRWSWWIGSAPAITPGRNRPAADKKRRRKAPFGLAADF